MKRAVRKVHVVATAIIGLQLVVWALTGFAFTLFDFDEVHGDRERDRKAVEALSPAAVRVSLADALTAARQHRGAAGPIVEATVRSIGGRPAYLVTFAAASDPVLIDGTDGAPRVLGADDARWIARHAYRGEAEVLAVDRIDAASQVPDVATPAFRVRFADPKHTEVFVSATTGEISAWRNDAWRRFDLLWSLHVMGYVSRDSPAHWPLRITGVFAVLAVLSGGGLLAFVAIRNARRLSRRKRGVVSASP